jgi:hypothetical protein
MIVGAMARKIAIVMLPTGIAIVALSVWMVPRQLPESAERIITYADIGIGIFLIICGLFAFLRRERSRAED